ncbi:Gfo/Idh/MocA family oxidoreductase [Candidatus Woesearchaeota archaeon]|jgi:predicted dehydrogenase|nr:Gfo/Idh/MocA family oxidoreductase [Candidatus Woesearchaeota archaeon]MBT4796440.1 Gfo/Idh/MocA family oxidoreductase [Candidatus Neomarinimicrobiota bacterium]
MTLSLGFIGGGINSVVGRTHYSASQMDGVWKLEAGVFSRDQAINIQTASEWGVSRDRLYSTIDEMVKAEQSKLDAVVVLTPTPDHVEAISTLLKHNIPVISEKALVSTTADVEKIRDAFNSTDSFLAVTYNYSGYPMVRELRHRIAENELGKINQIQIEMPADAFMRATPQPWRLVDGEIPTILLDLGVHLHHLCYFLTDLNPLEVNADFHNYSRFDGIVDDAHIWVKYEEEMNASLWMSKTAPGNRNGLKIRLFGEKGSAEWYQMDPEHLTISDLQGRRVTIDRGSETISLEQYARFKPGHPIGFVEAFANLYSDIAASLLDFKNGQKNEHPYVYGLEHAAQGLHLLAASNISHQQRTWVKLNDYY